MASTPAPAIRTAYDERYSEIEHIEMIGSDTTFHRGFGETGTKVELVDMRAHDGCPRCGTNEMVLSRSLNPEGHDDALFYCTNPKCRHFVADAVEYDMNTIRATEPSVWDNTAECPVCETRHTVAVERHSRRHDLANDGTSCIVEEPCAECKTDMEVDA